MKVISYLGIALCASFATGCRPEREVATKFVMAEHDPFMRTGTSAIEGQGFMRQQGGGVVRCAGEEVTLVPATPYFREYTAIAREGGIPKDIERLKSFHSAAVRRATCDADGKFKFEKLPSGKWIVSTRVRWMAGNAPQGGVLVGDVEVSPNSTSTVVLGDRSSV
jgi:hypothetical protein